MLQTLARRVARFDWAEAPVDTAATLYQAAIPPEERRQLGEYFTPTWLVRTMIRELVDDPLNQRVLDPACGSGTFVAEAGVGGWAFVTKRRWSSREAWRRLCYNQLVTWYWVMKCGPPAVCGRRPVNVLQWLDSTFAYRLNLVLHGPPGEDRTARRHRGPKGHGIPASRRRCRCRPG